MSTRGMMDSIYEVEIVRNHVKLRVFCIDTLLWILAMSLVDLLRIAHLHCRKVGSIKWLKHKLRATIGGQ